MLPGVMTWRRDVVVLNPKRRASQASSFRTPTQIAGVTFHSEVTPIDCRYHLLKVFCLHDCRVSFAWTTIPPAHYWDTECSRLQHNSQHDEHLKMGQNARSVSPSFRARRDSFLPPPRTRLRYTNKVLQWCPGLRGRAVPSHLRDAYGRRAV